MIESESFDDLRRTFREAVGKEPVTGADCPSPERIWAAVRGEVEPTEVQSLLEHTLGCRGCARNWRLARAVSQEASDGALQDRLRERSSRRWKRPAWWLVAASILVAVGIQVAPKREPPTLRRAAQPPALESLIPEGASLPRGDFLLRWREGQAGTLYTVQVVTEDLQPVASARNLAESQFRVPESSLASLPEDARLFWEVRMESPDGRRLTSPAFSVRLGK